MFAPVALIVGLALAGGGFDVSARHIAGLAVWLAVVGLLVLGAASRARLAWPLYWSAGLIVGLAMLSALSSLWSGSMELSVIEADRVLIYLGMFLAAFLIAQTDQRRQRFAEGLAIAVTAVVILGLLSRLFPHIVVVNDGFGSGPRLRYPLGYWNANGAYAGIAVAMLLWLTRRGAWAWLRWASAAAIPAALLTLYFTYSRGGLLALVVAAGCLIALSRDRLWMLATLGVGAIGSLPAILAVQSRHALADNLAGHGRVDQGLTVFLILLGGMAITLLLYALVRRIEAREGGLTGRMVELSRHPGLLKGIAATIAVAGIVAAIAVGGRAWHQFSSSDLEFPSNPAQHFSQLSGAGRYDFWRVALDGYEEAPVAGQGAGSYKFDWLAHRSIANPVEDAHSLYIESFDELGTIGGLLVLGLIGTMLWCGFCAWRYAPPTRRDAYAALFAAMLAFAVGAAIDWFWEIADMGAIFFLAGGVLVSVRCAQLASANDAPGAAGRRYGLAIAGLAAAWISAVALIGPLLVDRELSESKAAAASGNVGSAIDHASTARSIEPWAASPYLQLGLLTELQGDYPAAQVEFTRAIEREDRNWQLYFLRSRVEEENAEAASEAGDTPTTRKSSEAAEADLEKVRQLNPLGREP